MNLLIEAGENRKELKEDGLKIYGTNVELREIADAIEKALREGLVQGWVGVGTLAGSPNVFPHNDVRVIPVKKWKE